EEARKAQQGAEETAQQRQEDLMIITHQLQGPLASITGAISFLQMKSLPKEALDDLEYVEALVEDGIALCYGTFTTFALKAGRKHSFGRDEIDATKELRRLCERLRRTNSRDDLTFSYYQEKNFPTL